MKINHLSFFVSVVLLVLIGGVLITMKSVEDTQPRSNDPIPYIYYYSDLAGGFVIEKADGTDSRLLAQNIMPKTHDVIDSVHWSPSGQYLAWRSHQHNGPGSYEVSGWLGSTDGKWLSKHLQDASDVFLMQWSPHQDWLAVGFYSGTYPDFYEVIRLIDVPNNRIVNEIRFRMDYGRFGHFSMPKVWAEDGSAIYHSIYTTGGRIITRINVEGYIDHWNYSNDRNRINFQLERVISNVQHPDNADFMSWIITDLSTNESHIYRSFRRNDTTLRNYDFVWNSDRTTALVTEQICQDEPHWGCQRERMALFNWETGKRYRLSENLRRYEPEWYFGKTEWSNNGKVILLIHHETKQFHLLDSLTQTTYLIDIEGVTDWDWIDESDVLFITQEAIEGELPRRTAYYYDWETHALSELVHISVNLASEYVETSPDSTFIGYIGTQAVTVQELATQERFTFPRHSNTNYGGPVTGYQWGDNPAWFFAGSNTVIAGGCCNSSAITIHHLDKPVGRELTLCYGVQTCVGFVPDHVLPYLEEGQTESYTPQPTWVLVHESPVRGLTWHPDGTKLATYSENRVHLWDMTTPNPTEISNWEIDLQCGTSIEHCWITWDTETTIRIIGYRIEERSRTDYQGTVNITSGDVTLVESDRTEGWIFSPSNHYEIQHDDEENAFVVDVETQQRLSDNPLQDFPRWLRTMFFDVDTSSNRLIGSSVHDRVLIWDIASGEQVGYVNWSGSMVALNPEQTLFAVAGSPVVSIWEMEAYRHQLAIGG